jgi:hypothetical protein
MRLVVGLGLPVLLVVTGFGSGPRSGKQKSVQKDQRFDLRSSKSANCSDPIDTCKSPVKFVEEEGGCYVFACEHGTSNEHLVRVSDEKARTRLQALAKETVENGF